MKIYWLIIPLLNACGVWLFIWLFQQFVVKKALLQVPPLFLENFDVKKEVRAASHYIQQVDLEQEASPLLDQRLNALIQQLKGEIPMGHVFFAGSLAERLKSRAKQEILGALPEVKERLIQKFSQVDWQTLIKQKMQQTLSVQKIESLLNTPSVKREWLKLKIYGALGGAALGLLEVLFLFWLS